MSSQKYVFRDPTVGPKMSPGQHVDLGIPKSDRSLPNPPLGMKRQKMRADENRAEHQPWNLKWSQILQVSCSQSTFWRLPSKSWYILREGNSCFQEGKSCFQEGESCFQKMNSCAQERGILCSRKEILFQMRQILFLTSGFQDSPNSVYTEGF